MAANASDVKKLRDATGAGFMDCKAVLEETNGDIDAALKLLRERGKAKAAKRATRTAAEGLIKAKIAANAASGVLVEVTCNTDFVARNPEFDKIVTDLADLAVANNAGDIEQLNVLPYLGKTVREVLVEQTATIGENIQVGRVTRFKTEGAGIVHAYIHPPGKIGVLVQIEVGGNAKADAPRLRELGQDICLQIAASSPQFLDKDSVDPAVLANERDIYKNKAINEGKPVHIAEKIVESSIKKFYEESCLLSQPFVKDAALTIDKVVAAAAKELGGTVKVVRFARLAVGENVPAEAAAE